MIYVFGIAPITILRGHAKFKRTTNRDNACRCIDGYRQRGCVWVLVLIREGKEKRQELLIDAKAKGNDPDEQRDLKYRLEKPDQPLVRLKVEHSGFSTLNNQRFGARFVGLVANPVDILLFHRKKETDGRGGVKRTKASKALEAPMVPQDHDEMKIEDLIKDNLQNADKKLEIIDEAKMSLALDDFVSKEVKQAMFEVANSMLSKQQKKVLTLRPSDEEEDVVDLQAKGQPVEQDGKPEELSAPVNKRAHTALMRSAPAPTRTTT